MPFTAAEFFQVFTAYNQAVWPMQALLTLLAVVILAMALFAPRQAGRIVAGGLALLWAWLAVGYHLAFFQAINPAAPLFAALSLLAAGAFAWQGLYRRTGCTTRAALHRLARRSHRLEQMNECTTDRKLAIMSLQPEEQTAALIAPGALEKGEIDQR